MPRLCAAQWRTYQTINARTTAAMKNMVKAMGQKRDIDLYLVLSAMPLSRRGPRAHLTLGKRGFAASVSASTVEGPTNRRKPPRRYIHPLSCLGLQDLDIALLPKGVGSEPIRGDIKDLRLVEPGGVEPPTS